MATPPATRCGSSPAERPLLTGSTMSERRQDFLTRFDWIRTGLCSSRAATT